MPLHETQVTVTLSLPTGKALGLLRGQAMFVYLREGSPFYQIGIPIGPRKVLRKSSKSKNKEEAQRIGRQWCLKLGIDLDMFFDKPETLTTYKNLWARCLLSWQKTRPKSYAKHFLSREKRILDALGSLPITKIKPLDIEDWRDKWGEDLAPASVNRILAIVRRSFNMAIRWELATKNPVNCEFLKEPDPRDNPLPLEAQEIFVNAWHEPHQTFIATALWQGMRRGDLDKLTVSCLNLDKKLAKLSDTKSGRTRYIRLLPAIAERLEKLVAGKKPEDLVFTKPDGRPLGRFDKRWKRICQRLNLPNFRYHDLKHSFCTEMTAAGVSLSQLKRITGNVTTKVLERYIHNTPDFQKAETEKFENHLASVH